MSVQFRLLGPVEVRTGGAVVPLGGVRQRALLALLLLRPNQVVSRDRLIDELWGEGSPDRAGHRLEVVVSRLRKSVGLGDVLVARSGGYVLEVDPDDVDAQRFERLVEQGRRANAEGRLGEAAALFEEALGLWRGEALGDLAYLSFARFEAERLEELRLEVIEERIDARLALGEHAQVIGELDTLLAHQPTRERIARQLMLALYQCERQAEALEVYRRTRAALVQELGIEPGPALREIERSILKQVPGLDVRRPTTVVPPVRLPVPATPFIGRAPELVELTALLRGPAVRLLTLTGAGGSGKTRLALRLAQIIARDYRDGVWFVGFADVTDPKLIALTLCQALAVAEAADMTPAARVQRWLADREVLLVLDNLEQLAEGSAALSALLAACAGVTLLVTSREPLHLAGEQQYEVPALEPKDAVALFESRMQAVVPGLIVHPKLAEAICARLDRLPLAIELAAARAKALSPPELYARLDKSLPLLTGGPRDAPQRQQTLKATIDWSYHLLNHGERHLFRRLSVFAGGFDLEAAEAVCDADLDGLQSLLDKSLLHRTERGRFFVLETTREYGHAQLVTAGELTQLRRDHADWFHRLAMRPEDHFRSPEQAAWLGRLYADTDNLRVALAWSFESDVARGLELATVLYRPWLMHGHVEELVPWFERAPAEVDVVDKRTRAAALRAFGETLNCINRYERARQVLQESLILFGEIDDRPGEASALNVLGMVSWAQGSLPQAIAHSEAALAIYRDSGDRRGMGRSLHLTGVYLRDASDFARGEAALQQARTMLSEIGDRSAAAASILCLGDLALDRGQSDQAANRYREALETVIEFGDERTRAYCIAGLACVAAMHGDRYAAGRLWAVAETVDGRLGMCFRPHERRRYDHILMPLADDHGFRAGQEAGSDVTLAQAIREVIDPGPAQRRRKAPAAAAATPQPSARPELPPHFRSSGTASLTD